MDTKIKLNTNTPGSTHSHSQASPTLPPAITTPAPTISFTPLSDIEKKSLATILGSYSQKSLDYFADFGAMTKSQFSTSEPLTQQVHGDVATLQVTRDTLKVPSAWSPIINKLFAAADAVTGIVSVAQAMDTDRKNGEKNYTGTMLASLSSVGQIAAGSATAAGVVALAGVSAPVVVTALAATAASLSASVLYGWVADFLSKAFTKET
jgi:hypothetical protein